jgi:phosphoribosylglycinamide formyltransferase-1
MNIGVLASHNGTNLQAMIDACEAKKLKATVCVVISNNSRSGAADRAKRHTIEFRHLSSATHPDSDSLDSAICDTLDSAKTDIVFLAGYMKKLGKITLEKYRGRILNTHPALLPKFGGKGMYGMNVHEAVIEAREQKSGVSIHIVDAEYDTGPVIAQCLVDVMAGDTPETLRERVMTRERSFVVETLQRIASGDLNLHGF